VSSVQAAVRRYDVDAAVPPLRVLYVSHTGLVGGAEWSLLELLRGMNDAVESCLASPDGELASLAREAGVPVATIAPVRLSSRLDRWQTLSGLTGILRTANEIRRAAGSFDADLIHANSVRAGLAAIVARGLGAPPVIVHVRDTLPTGPTGSVISALIRHGAAGVLANSRFTASTLGSLGHHAAVVYNPVDLDRFGPSGNRGAVRRELAIQTETPVLGVVAQLTPWKAQDDAIRILARVRRTFPDAELLLAGEAKFTERFTRYDNRAYADYLRRLADGLGVTEAVRFLGERRDVPSVLAALDLLLVPSWHEPFGRSVLEAMAAATPVVATAVGGPAEAINAGENGLLLPPRDPECWARAVIDLLHDSARRGALAARGREAAIAYARSDHVAAVVAQYRRALGARP
jgi:glycosyltransferase involved in cell wall biosynthesis